MRTDRSRAGSAHIRRLQTDGDTEPCGHGFTHLNNSVLRSSKSEFRHLVAVYFLFCSIFLFVFSTWLERSTRYSSCIFMHLYNQCYLVLIIVLYMLV